MGEHILSHGSIVSTRSSWALSNVAEKRALGLTLWRGSGVLASMEKGKSEKRRKTWRSGLDFHKTSATSNTRLLTVH
jgi:hypothetical protein